MELRAPGKKDETLAPVLPSAALRDDYERRLKKAIANMTASYEYWIRSKYVKAVDANQDAGRLPDMAMDAVKGDGVKARTNALFSELTRLRTYWTKYFDDFAAKLAFQATQAWYDQNVSTWNARIKRAGFDVKMDLTPSQKLILDTKVKENVSLIKSIQSQYHTDIEGIVSRNFLAGRDLAPMAEQIKKRGDVSTRRAALIARDQSNKATAQMNDARQRELGIKYAYWVHSSAGKEPREKHVRAGREQWVFRVGEGIDFNDGMGTVLPGEAINCRCTCRTIIPALGRGDVKDERDLEPVPGYPGAYRAKKGVAVGKKTGIDVVDTRSPKGSPVKYS